LREKNVKKKDAGTCSSLYIEKGCLLKSRCVCERFASKVLARFCIEAGTLSKFEKPATRWLVLILCPIFWPFGSIGGRSLL
jgi:hypothetical protein